MKPSGLWAIVILFFVAIGALWMYWNKPEQPAAVALTSQPTPKSEPTPAPAPAAPAVPAVAKVAAPVVLVYFDFDRSAVRSGEAPKLDELTARLKGGASANVDALGYADPIGETPYNDQLSKKRADAVVAYLVARGVDAARVHGEGKGESMAVTVDACANMGAENSTNQKLVECLQRERRVEITLN
ncbi:MAG: OmpA family protein [Betaproteobacteria bacterium]